MQADNPSSSVVPIAGGIGTRTPVSQHSLDEPYVSHTATAEHNARLAAVVADAALPHSDLELTTAHSSLPQHLQVPHHQAAQQSTDAETLQLNTSGAKSIASNQNQSRGAGRGTPLGQSGKGRGRGRHRVTIE